MLTKTHQQGQWTVDVRYFEAVFGRSEIKSYEIEEAGILRSRKWRARFGETVMPLFQQLPGVLDFEFENPEDLLKLMPFVQQLVLNALDDVFELLVLYSEELEVDRDWIEANATDRQVVTAFMGVLQLAVPFELDNILANLNGLASHTTGSSSPSQNGDTSPEKTSE